MSLIPSGRRDFPFLEGLICVGDRPVVPVFPRLWSSKFLSRGPTLCSGSQGLSPDGDCSIRLDLYSDGTRPGMYEGDSPSTRSTGL